MKILAIGDVTSRGGVEHLDKNLWRVRRENAIDLCVVNGENASFVSGISEELAELLFRAGADVISGGNHTLHNRAAYTYLDDTSAILRPVNFGDGAPGHGYVIVPAAGRRVLVICAMGNVNMNPTLDLPFAHVDRVLEREAGNFDFAVLDIHAEATGEKYAVAYAYDGRINVVFGTHTHVPTADEQILPRGTGYISDLGMCGESGGILGMDADVVVLRTRTKLPYKFKPSAGVCRAEGAIFTLDDATGKTLSVQRIRF